MCGRNGCRSSIHFRTVRSNKNLIVRTAPQIARRLTRSAGTSLAQSALMRGHLLLSADWAAQHACGVQLPIGVMTVSIGGICFLLLLVREGRR
ncbi:iron chelate uptake ABC transporter family permease subunit [Agrobacterium tumefaciens]|uniref:iron chelate uptake ABC transporter family permease subunit n=1 Tax=Agrobacterium tumefaciens TaxID=358 RepID=UPI00129B09B6|nr:iron chelate uptake ABC transporter family permease subunit [Agrobacterium tumefaciens]MRH98242.1 iron chelate uptake ABC transporter family permease subunit [Agrobacterium tumefaciens]